MHYAYTQLHQILILCYSTFVGYEVNKNASIRNRRKKTDSVQFFFFSRKGILIPEFLSLILIQNLVSML